MKGKANETRTSPRCRGQGFDIKCLKCGADAQIIYYDPETLTFANVRSVKIQCKKCKNRLIVA